MSSAPAKKKSKLSRLEQLQNRITRCDKCDRLRSWCKETSVTKVKRFKGDKYWGKPVPAFGDPNARLIIVGLAPAAHGANRTGRMFTGDRSGDWLYRALHRAGFASQAESKNRDDGLVLRNCFISAAARCAPPQNKLLREELDNCQNYLEQELHLLTQRRVLLCLGGIAFQATRRVLKCLDISVVETKVKFGHGQQLRLSDGTHLLLSYHPSQQNTFTGRLTEEMFDQVFAKSNELLAGS